MKLALGAVTIVSAILWGGTVLLTGLINLMAPSYGVEFLRTVSSLYPGFHASRTFGDVMVGTLYAIVDGAVCGLMFGWLYNLFASRRILTRTL